MVVATGDGTEVPLGAEVAHWDFQTTLNLHSAVAIDRKAALQDSDLGTETELAIIVLARSDHTNAHGAVARVLVPPQPRYDLAIELQLPGHVLGGRLDLTTQLVAMRPRPLSPLAARRPGSILWHSRHRCHLEGSAARFPTDASDFRVTRPSNARAGWHLHVDTTDPQASFMSTTRLTLNTASEGIRRVLAGDSKADVDVLMSALRWDVTRHLVLRAIACDDIEDGPADHDSTTVVGVLRSLLAQIWPLDMPSTLRERWRSDPDLLELQLQNHARLATA
jgi:hypothetical protein